jgi:hypothetical protein
MAQPKICFGAVRLQSARKGHCCDCILYIRPIVQEVRPRNGEAFLFSILVEENLIDEHFDNIWLGQDDMEPLAETFAVSRDK